MPKIAMITLSAADRALISAYDVAKLAVKRAKINLAAHAVPGSDRKTAAILLKHAVRAFNRARIASIDARRIAKTADARYARLEQLRTMRLSRTTLGARSHAAERASRRRAGALRAEAKRATNRLVAANLSRVETSS